MMGTFLMVLGWAVSLKSGDVWGHSAGSSSQRSYIRCISSMPYFCWVTAFQKGDRRITSLTEYFGDQTVLSLLSSGLNNPRDLSCRSSILPSRAFAILVAFVWTDKHVDRWTCAYYLHCDRVIPVSLAEHDNHSGCYGTYTKGHAILSEMDEVG